MLILALDTTHDRCGAVLWRDGAVVVQGEDVISRGHAEALPPMVADLLELATVSPADVDLLAVTTGPGTFTGVRVGVAFARGWALATGRPVLGVSALQAVAEAVGEGPVTAVLETRRGEVQWQHLDRALRPQGPPELVSRAAAEAGLAERRTLVGRLGTLGLGLTGLARVAAEPSATGALQAALRALDRGERPVPGTALEPLYLRAVDADPGAGRALVGRA